MLTRDLFAVANLLVSLLQVGYNGADNQTHNNKRKHVKTQIMFDRTLVLPDKIRA